MNARSRRQGEVGDRYVSASRVSGHGSVCGGSTPLAKGRVEPCNPAPLDGRLRMKRC